MSTNIIKATCLIPETKVSDVHFNKQAIEKCYHQNPDSAILLTPELSLTGYTCQDLFFQKTFLNTVLSSLNELAKETSGKGNLLVVGAPLIYQDRLYNCAVFLFDGEIIGIVPKTYIPNYGEFYEARWFQSGKDIKNQTLRIQEKDVPFGTDLLFVDQNSCAVLAAEICEDLWVGDKPSTKACLNGANIILNLSASDENVSKSHYRRELVKMQSSTMYCSYLYCSSSTMESSQDLVFSGHNLIVENGTILKECIYPKGGDSISALLDLDKSTYNRIHQSTFETRMDNYRSIYIRLNHTIDQKTTIESKVSYLKDEGYSIDPNPFVPSQKEERKARCLEILSIQAHGLATRVANTNIQNLVIGISGGLDSTLALLVAAQARKTIPSIHIIGITMPSEGMTTNHTKNNAINLMEELNVEIREVPIRKTVESHLKDIGHSIDYQGENDIAFENAQARMRTYILMDVANMEHGLVVGTGDLSELALGWCTYNGDHMSMYAVNSSVPKTLVKYIVESYADTLADEKLHDTLHSIIDTPISPELTPNANGAISQKTEDKIGKYELNDFFLFYFLRYGFTPEKILVLALLAHPEIPKEKMKITLENFYKRFYSQHFKRSCLPDGPKVGSVTLSPRGDYRMPSDASVNTLLDEVKKL
jgi:NAD+ synthase (glutamine-hydrolysing)